MNEELAVVCFTRMHPVLLEDIEKVSHVRWVHAELFPSKFFPNFEISKLALWNDGTLAYFDDLSVIQEGWDEVEPEDFLEKCGEMFPIDEG